MDQGLQATTGREYEDFEPETTTIQEEDRDTLLVHLPGFRKEQMKVELRTNKTLLVTAEHQVENNKWRRVQKEYPVSANCDTDNIKAKFEIEESTLRITLPKLKETPSEDVPQPQEKGPDIPVPQPQAKGPDIPDHSRTTDQSPQRDNELADNYASKENQREGKEKTEKPISRNDEHKRGDHSMMNMFLVALLVLLLGFFASTWFGSSEK